MASWQIVEYRGSEAMPYTFHSTSNSFLLSTSNSFLEQLKRNPPFNVYMFSRSSNLLIAGGNFIDKRTTSHYHGTKARDILLQNSAPGAFHNSGERFDPPKCHPDTRTHILNKIMDWVVGKVGWEGFIKWLYGPAGAGKSAIAQTIAEMCEARHFLLASFFFSRTDPKRNNEKYLIPSIAYQIAVNAPMMRDAIDAAVDGDPAIFQRSIEAQLTTLVINPLTQLSRTGIFQSNPIPNLIVIDGLDECNDYRVQQHILHTFSLALQLSEISLKLLICSRAEPHLTLEFTSLTSEGVATRLSLDDGYEQNADIERYLRDSFHKIATTHPLKKYIPSAWPTNDVLSTLVRKSSGQFIFAATVVKYISSNRHQPTRRLEIILGMHPSRNDRPFAELDALYMGILSVVEDVKATLGLLGVLILCILPQTPRVVGKFMFLNPVEVERLLLDLSSVVECMDMDTAIRMLHASFPDFLLDRSRSGQYYIDASMMQAEITLLCLSHIEVHHSDGCVTCREERFYCEALCYALRCMIQHLPEAEPSADLRQALLNTCYITYAIKLETFEYAIYDSLAKFLFLLKSSKFTDTDDLYLHHCNIYDRIMRKRIADVSLDFGSVVGLVFARLQPEIGLLRLNESFTDYFPAVQGGLLRIHQTLYFRPLGFNPDSCSVKLLTEFLTDPGRAGDALDGPKCALVARFLLDCFISPSSQRSNFLCNLSVHDYSDLLSETGTLLSKASHSDDLITRINHTDIGNCEFFTSMGIPIDESDDYVEKRLRTLIQGIGDYLTRVDGSVPIELKITLRVHDILASEYRCTPTFGPFYYETRGNNV